MRLTTSIIPGKPLYMENYCLICLEINNRLIKEKGYGRSYIPRSDKCKEHVTTWSDGSVRDSMQVKSLQMTDTSPIIGYLYQTPYDSVRNTCTYKEALKYVPQEALNRSPIHITLSKQTYREIQTNGFQLCPTWRY